MITVVKNLGQYNRPRVLGCEPVDGVLDVLSSKQINITTFVHPIGEKHHLPSGSVNVALFNSFQLRTTSTPSTGSHPSTLGLSYWPKFFVVNLIVKNIKGDKHIL